MDTTSAPETALEPQHRGFAAVPNWLVMDTSVSAHEKLVYLVLSSMIGAQGSWFTEHKVIALRSGISESSIQRALKSLRARGVVDWRPRYHPDNPKIRLGNVYRITVDTLGLSDWGVVSEGHQGGVSVTEKKKNPEEETPPTPSDDGFDAVWEVWPRKVNRAAAKKAWSRLTVRQRDEILPALVEHANAHRENVRADPPSIQYVPHLASWLNGSRWEDSLPEKRVPHLGGKQPARPGVKPNDEWMYR